MQTLGTIEGRLGKTLRASESDVVRELARARLDRSRALPVSLDALRYVPPDIKVVNTIYERLGFSELLVADKGAVTAEVADARGDVTRALALLGHARPIAIHALLEDAAEGLETLSKQW